jgi:hypothetical protein
LLIQIPALPILPRFAVRISLIQVLASLILRCFAGRRCRGRPRSKGAPRETGCSVRSRVIVPTVAALSLAVPSQRRVGPPGRSPRCRSPFSRTATLDPRPSRRAGFALSRVAAALCRAADLRTASAPLGRTSLVQILVRRSSGASPAFSLIQILVLLDRPSFVEDAVLRSYRRATVRTASAKRTRLDVREAARHHQREASPYRRATERPYRLRVARVSTTAKRPDTASAKPVRTAERQSDRTACA